jgi:phage baseplate assembly protein gpV
MFPQLGLCQVIGRSTSPWGVYVLQPSIQATGVLVQMGVTGSADALRVNQPPLPTEGTWGLVAWPYGDSRNGVWVCSVYTQGNTAIDTSNPDVSYNAYPSGVWTHIDQSGNTTLSLPDGSYVTFGNSGVKPELTRQTVNAQQEITTIPYPDSTRQASTPNPLPMTINLASGTSIKFDTSGNMDVNLASGATMNITQGGSATDFLALVSKLVTAFNNHYHRDESSSDTPAVQWTAETVNSVLVDIQK